MRKYALILGLAMISTPVWAGDMPEGWKPPAQSSELQRIKALEGRWEGIADEKGEGEPAVVEYRLTSGGTAVEERLGPGSSQEMVSMYHDVNGKLSMTHYCMLGNQPELELRSSSARGLTLAESASSAARLGGQMRMASLVLEQPDANSLVQVWTATGADGKPMEPSIFKYKRV